MTDTAEAMNLLNEVAVKYPSAISFAAGRPPDKFLAADRSFHWMSQFVEFSGTSKRMRTSDVWTSLGQYSATNGIFTDIVSKHLAVDEGLSVNARSCMITNGAQEAIVVSLLGVVGRKKCVVAVDPTYVGLTGAAEVLGIPVATVEEGPNMLANLASMLEDKRTDGSPKVGAVYCIPDFSNPMGRVLSTSDRKVLLSLAELYDFYIIEDAAYRYFRYDGPILPTIKSLDQTGRVLFIHSFAKIFMPGVRTAVLIADKIMPDGRTLAGQLSSIKSYVSVANSPITQAIVAGFLIEHEYSLRDWVEDRREWCRTNRNVMTSALSAQFSQLDGTAVWEEPSGGFFLPLRLQAAFTRDDFARCASDHGVIVVPLALFSSSNRYDNFIRLSFSNLDQSQIAEGIDRLARFVSSQTPRGWSPR